MTPPVVRLRPAGPADRLPVWRWRNDPETRRASFHSAPVTLDEHSRWFEDILRRPDRRLYVLQADGADAGVVRLDMAGQQARVSINIAPEWRGRGVGTRGLRALSREAFGGLGLGRLVAEVKAENAASRAAFARAGYAIAREGDPVIMARTERLRVIAAIQARLRSARLPGKVLRPIAGRPVLDWIIRRLRHAKEIDEIVVSTTTASADDAVEGVARAAGVGCFRGSEDDVVDRFLATTRAYAADALVRITADCPLVDPAIVDRLVSAFRERRGATEYVSNVYPSTFPHGLDVEVLSGELLERLDREVEPGFYRDWFSAFVREHPERYTMLNVRHTLDLHEHRWTVDYPEDLAFVDEVVRDLGDAAETSGMADILAVLQRRPELRDINRHLEDSEIIRGIRSATYHWLLAGGRGAPERRDAGGGGADGR